MPLLVFLGLNYLTDVDKEMVYAGTIIAALPMPTIFAMLGQVYGVGEKSLTTLLMSTIVGFIIVSGLITIWWA
jgi:malonate transporter and related proteins